MTFDRRDAGSTTEPRRRVQWNLMRVLRAYISFSAKLNSNPGLRVSTFSRDARTPEAIKAYRNFKLVTISNSFARTSGTHEEDARHKALGFEPVTLSHQNDGPASKDDSTQKGHRLKAWSLCRDSNPRTKLKSTASLTYPESNPGLQVSTFSRDARTPGTKKKLTSTSRRDSNPKQATHGVTV